MKLLRYLKPYWYFALLAPLCMICEVTVDLFQPRLMSAIVDEGVLTGDLNFIITTGIKMILLAILGGFGGLASAGFASAAAQSFGNDLRKDTYHAVIRLSPGQTDRFTTGSLITRLTGDVTTLQEMVGMALRMFVRSPMMFLGGIAMALTLDIRFGLILLLALPLELAAIWLVLGKARPFFVVVREKLDRVNSVLLENVSGARVVKAFVREKRETDRFSQANDDFMQTSLRVQRLMAVIHPVMNIILNVSILTIIYIGGWAVEAREMQVGQVMAAVTYVTQILMSIMMISMMFQNISRATASAGRVREVLSTAPELADGQVTLPSAPGTLAFEGVSFSYNGAEAEPVLKDISFRVAQGEWVAVLGATGSGKTSLVNLISRFYEPTAGQVSVGGLPAGEYTLKALREQIGYCLQKSELFSGTIAENIAQGKENATREEIVAAAKIAQADSFITSFVDGYDTVIGEKGASLSGGQKQRVSLARAILRRPDILILDDSTSALDLGTESRLHAALRKEFGKTTVLIIAQRIASVRNADKIIVLDKGRIVGLGTHRELQKNCEVYGEICRSQGIDPEEGGADQ